MKSSWQIVCSVLLLPLGLTVNPARGATKYPGLESLLPVAVEMGKTTNVEIRTNGDVTTSYKVLVEGEGVTGKVLPRVKNQAPGIAVVALTVAPDAAVGPREIRLATKEAVTTLGRLYVTAHPAQVEVTKHQTREEAQPISFPAAMSGRIEKAVEEDWYKFEAKKGEQIHFTVLGARLHETIHKIGRFVTHFDALIRITDDKGIELAVGDDYFFADPFVSFTVPRDGMYFVGVRDSTYKGSVMYSYSLVGVKGSWPTQYLPLALPRGRKSTVQVLGPGYSPETRGEVNLPDSVPLDERFYVRADMEGSLQQEVPVWPTEHSSTPEVEDNGSASTAQKVTFPAAIAGSIGSAGDVDFFSLAAKKGERFEFEVVARRLFSPVDTKLTIFDSKGRPKGTNDDFQTFKGELTKDSFLDWTAPADGEYTVELRDVMGKGGSEYGYHLSLVKAQPDFRLTCDPSFVMVGPGSRTPIFVRVQRRGGFDGPVAISLRGLPAGVRVSPLTIPPAMTDGCLVFEAAADAPIDAANIAIEGAASLPRGEGKVDAIRAAVPLAEIYQALRRPVRTFAVAVTEPSDIAVETPVTKIELRPGESAEIPVKVNRAPKYKEGPITLWADWQFEIAYMAVRGNQARSQSRSQLTLNGSATEGKGNPDGSARCQAHFRRADGGNRPGRHRVQRFRPVLLGSHFSFRSAEEMMRVSRT
ncbi:MAG: PPC domain-containing protein [Planctomycetota bacterium]